MIIVLIIALAAVIVLVLYNEWGVLKIMYRIERMLKDVPNPPGIPVFRCLFEFTPSERILSSAMRYQKEYGGVVKINLFAYISGMMVTDARVNEFILSTTTILNKSMTYYFLCGWDPNS